MAGIQDIVQVTISANTRTPTRAGFGTPILMGFHNKFPEKVRTYTDLTGLVSDGFGTGDPLYKMASALLSQNPRPERFKVGRLTAAHAQTQTLTVLTDVEGQKIGVKVTDTDGTTILTVNYTIPAAQSTTLVATAVAALIDAMAGVAASSVNAVITVTPSVNGKLVFFRDLVNLSTMDNTPAAGFDTDLTAVQLVDDDWYFVLTDVNSQLNITPMAVWAEARTKFYLTQTQDSGELDGTGTILSGQKALARDRTVIMVVAAAEEYASAAWAGAISPKDPGSITWAFKGLAGVTPLRLTASQETQVKAQNGNFYATVAGLGVTLDGRSTSGKFADIRHGIDWLTARIQERIFGWLANADKIPYTDASVDTAKGEILAVLGVAVRRNFLAAGTLSTSAPKVADVDPADRADRILPDVKFGADLAGAIHRVRVVGTLSI